VQFVASYTWSHAITSGEDFFGLSEPADFVNIKPERGPAFNDIRHAANMGVVLDSGHMTTNRYAGFFANNLGLSWVGQLQSGRPYPISTGSAGFANGRFFGAGSETQQRPNVLPDGTLSVAGLASAFGDNAAPTAIPVPGAAQCLVPGTSVTTFGASCLGAIDPVSGNVIDFQQVSGNLGRDAGRGSPFVKFDGSLHKSFGMPRYENIKLELRFDAFNVFNHTNWTSFNSNDVLTILPLSASASCTLCQRPNGTFAGASGQTLHLSDLQHGKISSNLLNPTFGILGDPGNADVPRLLQLSFHVRF
jgi:hypothetical protein